MDIENVDVQDDVVEQEDQTSAEEEQDFDDESQEEETVTIPKSKFVKLKRKATAYDAGANKSRKEVARPTDEKWKQKIELRTEGFDDDAIEFILKNGGKKALENPYVVQAIESMKEKKKAEAAVIGNEGEKSSVEKRFTPGDFAKLSHEDQLKALSEIS